MNGLTRRLGIDHPIIQAPMAGGATTVDLVAAVCRAGALGGGIMDGSGIAAALALGAEAAQLGTAFLTCDEAGIPAAYKQAIVDASEDQTRITRAFSGRSARGIVNRLMADIDREADAILPFRLQNALTRVGGPGCTPVPSPAR